MARKLILHLEEKLPAGYTAYIEGSTKDISSLIELRKTLFDKTETWAWNPENKAHRFRPSGEFSIESDIWYIVYDESFLEELKLWEDVYSTSPVQNVES